MPILEKTETLTLQEPSIDHDHDVFIHLVNQMQKANQAEFTGLFNNLLEHTKAHFDYENRLMDEYGFPAITEHKGEHRRVLTELVGFKRRLDKGMITMVRAYVTELVPQWFTLHVTTMDSALVAHVNKQKNVGLVQL